MTVDFKPSTIPSQAGKTILVTGATAGLGAGSVAALAEHSPAHIILSGRNAKTAEATISKLKESYPGVRLTFVRMDLNSLASVQSGAQEILDGAEPLDTVMLNAGVMALPPGVSADGYEQQWAANVLGHALLVKLLTPQLERSAAAGRDVRVVSLTSTAESMAMATGIHFASLRSEQNWLGFPLPGGAWGRYAQSKLGNLLYARALAKHHPSITSVVVHPGVIKTGLFENITASAKPVALAITAVAKITPVEQGWWNQVWAATCPKSELQNGGYYQPVGSLAKGSGNARSDALAEQLWTWLDDALKDYN